MRGGYPNPMQQQQMAAQYASQGAYPRGLPLGQAGFYPQQGGYWYGCYGQQGYPPQQGGFSGNGQAGYSMQSGYGAHPGGFAQQGGRGSSARGAVPGQQQKHMGQQVPLST